MPMYCSEKQSLHYLVRGQGEPLLLIHASLLALLTDQPLPPRTRWIRDNPVSALDFSLTGSIAEEHALSAGAKLLQA
jgi:hypothetical protein